MYLIWLTTLCFSFYACASAGGSSSAVKQVFLLIGEYNDCEGKHADNYTLILEFQSDQTCTSFTPDTFVFLVQNNGDTKKVNSLQPLVASAYPKGAYNQFDGIYLVTSGPLQGKYIYERTLALVESYLKKCSSVLGLSYIKSKSAVLLISNKLDLNVLLSPTGAFDEFKKSNATVCNGVYTVV